MSEQIAPSPPLAQIDAPAPDFEARSTQGPLQLSGYRGQWVVLFSHPADFTPVCTSEFVALAERAADFANRNAALIGLSVDSVFAHLAWLDDIERRFGVQVEFPLIEDISMSIARAYGMIHEHSTSTAAVRSVFFIDPEGLIRAIIHYPLSVGRSVDEMLRVLTALQVADAQGVSLPEGWQPGRPGVSPAPTTRAEQQQRGAETAWYFSEKEVDDDA